MAAEGRTQLKTYFETKDRPTAAQFANLIDSVVNSVDDAISEVEAQAGTDADVMAWSSLRVRQAVIAGITAAFEAAIAIGTAATNDVLLYNGTNWVNSASQPLSSLQTYADNAAAVSAGLSAGDLYRKSDGTVMVRY